MAQYKTRDWWPHRLPGKCASAYFGRSEAANAAEVANTGKVHLPVCDILAGTTAASAEALALLRDKWTGAGNDTMSGAHQTTLIEPTC
jgi:hypothetical protein